MDIGPGERLTALRRLHWECGLGTLQLQSLLGIGYVAFVVWLGASEPQIGLLAALLSLAQLVQLPAAGLTARIRHGRRFVVVTGIASGGMLASIVLVPLLAPEGLRVPVVMCLVAVAAALGASGLPLFNAWFANLLPRDGTAAYLANRNIVASGVALVAAFAIGWLLDLAPGYPGFAVLFALGFAATVAGRAVLARVPDITRTSGEQATACWRHALREPFRHPAFIRFAAFFIVWQLANGVSVPFAQVFMMRTLHVPLREIGLLTAITTLVALVTFKPWGAVLDRNSNRSVLQLGFALSFPVIAAYLLTWPARYEVLYVIAVANGILGSGLNLAVNNLFYEILPRGNEKVVLLGFYAATVGLVGFVGPVIGGLLAPVLSRHAFDFHGVHVDQFRMLFAITAAGWIPALWLLRRVPEKRATSLRELLVDMMPGRRRSEGPDTFH
ncbi:MAG TPA: MFS transporter [Chthonomonadales bacterium]|nr:MFS transporter [Chthonomonadales bacterium]